MQPESRTPAPKWIGGEWTLADVGGVPPLSWCVERFLGPHYRSDGYALVNSGRVALRRAIEALGGTGGTVLLPAYGCPALTQAARDAGAVPAYYPGDGLLRPLWPELESLAHRTSARVVVVVHAFGFLQDGDAIRRVARACGASVIEDCSHTLCNAPGRRFVGPGASDALVASLRKVLPVPEGGLWALWKGPVVKEGAPCLDDAFASAREDAFRLPPGPARHLALQRAERLLDACAPPGHLGPAALAALAALAEAPEALEGRWRNRCRDNWLALARHLAGTGARFLHSALHEGVSPPGTPILHANRHRLAAYLLEKGVEATLHWPLVPQARPALTREERRLAGTILTLPCDGRYDESDLARMTPLISAIP